MKKEFITFNDVANDMMTEISREEKYCYAHKTNYEEITFKVKYHSRPNDNTVVKGCNLCWNDYQKQETERIWKRVIDESKKKKSQLSNYKYDINY